MVVMVGPALAAKGGVASVCAAYADGGLFERLNIVYLASFVTASALRKAAAGLGALATFAAMLVPRRVAVLHVHMAAGTSVWRKLAFCGLARLAGVPYVIHLHSGKFTDYFDKCCGPLRQGLIRNAVRRSSALLYLSSATGRWLDDRRLWAPRRAVLPNPAPCAAVLPVRASNEPNERLLFLGRLEEAKGLSVLLKAFALVAARRPAAELWLGGEGDRAHYQTMVGQLGIEPGKVKFLGWVDNAQKSRLWAEVQVFVLPSRFEGQPMGLLEAMGQGLPGIATAVGGIPDVVESGRTGLVVPVDEVNGLAEAIEALLGDPAMRTAMGIAAHQHVQSVHAVSAIGDWLAALYSDLARQHTV